MKTDKFMNQRIGWGSFLALSVLAGCSSGGSAPATSGAGSSPTAAPSASATATASPTPTPTPAVTANPSGFTITGPSPAATYAAFDGEIKSFMRQYGIRAGQLAVAKGGHVLYSHAYTNSTDPTYMITLPTSIMRVSSNSKALVTAAMTMLFAENKVTPSTPVWSFLGIARPLLPSQTPDARAGQITVQELIDHTAGLGGSSSSDPEFNMYEIEGAAGNSGPLTEAQYAAYLYGQPLNSNPGSTMVYSNDGYFLLQEVIQKATGENYMTWVDANVLAPIGITDAIVSATALSGKRSNETTCDDPFTGPSVLFPKQSLIVPDCYGGITVYEIDPGSTSISISAQSLASFAGHYDVYGLGPRAAGYAREGSFVGSVSWMESLNDGYDFAFSFNRRVDQNGNIFSITPLTQYFEQNI
jgi:CubicO group peptidase (beta-lactamase class C family)